MDQADVFALNTEQVQKIWAKRFGESVSWSFLCDDYVSASLDDDRCLMLFGNACIRSFLQCQGRCPSYIVDRGEIHIEG